jgi:hypothetical protein
MNRSRVCLSPNMEDRRQAGLAGKRCSRLASQQQRQDVAFEPLRPTSSGWLEARLNLESATCLYGRFGIDGLRTHTHSRVAGVVHEPTVGVVPAAGQHRAIPSWPRPMTTVSLSGRFAVNFMSADRGQVRGAGSKPPRPLSSQTPTSRCRSATAGRRARARESPPGVGHAAIGTRVALRYRSRLPARQHVRP